MNVRERDLSIWLAWRTSARSLRDIGAEHGISVERTRQIAYKVERQMTYADWREAPHLASLSTRAVNNLRNHFNVSWDDLTPELASTATAAELLAAPNMGLKSLKEVRDWLHQYGLELRGWRTQDTDGKPSKPPNFKIIEQYVKYLEKHGWTVIPPIP